MDVFGFQHRNELVNALIKVRKEKYQQKEHIANNYFIRLLFSDLSLNAQINNSIQNFWGVAINYVL